jgi:lactate 2-monooxygenase
VEVRAAVEVPLLVDGGVRGGADVLKALCVGADAVLLGRPYAYGLAAGGQDGVLAVLEQFAGETDLTLALLGARGVSELDESWIAAS